MYYWLTFLYPCFVLYMVYSLTSVLLDFEILYCADEINEAIIELNGDIDPFQGDYITLNELYDKYRNINDENLTVADLKEKRDLEESLRDSENGLASNMAEL